MSFKDKVILITGASSKIGAACAEYFAEKGALLALVSRNEEKLANVVKKIKENGYKNDPLVILADVSTDTKRIIYDTIGKYKCLDILINNAGFRIEGTIENTEIADFDSMIATNVRAVLLLTQLATPYLIASKGNVVNVSSVAGLRATPNALAYCMSKAALDQFTRCIALELADRGVRVNSVNPALNITNFDFNLGMNYAVVDKLYPVGRAGQAYEVVDAIAFLANESAGFVTGTCLPIDGGLSITGLGIPGFR